MYTNDLCLRCIWHGVNIEDKNRVGHFRCQSGTLFAPIHNNINRHFTFTDLSNKSFIIILYNSHKKTRASKKHKFIIEIMENHCRL